MHARGVAERRGNKGGANLLREPQAALGGDAETGGEGRGGESAASAAAAAAAAEEERGMAKKAATVGWDLI